DDCNRKTRLCVGSAKTRLMATDETEKQQKQNPEPFRVGSVSEGYHAPRFGFGKKQHCNADWRKIQCDFFCVKLS
ncbi:MAG: hypothetical protein QW177_06490, partial [Candidatus Nitrosotenuis sp.]